MAGRDRQHEIARVVWGRFTLDGYINPSGPPSILLDVDALGRTEGVPWTFDGAGCLPPAYTRCLVRLSRGGSEAVEIREFDTVNRRFVENGFVAPEDNTQTVWADENTIYMALTSRPDREWVGRTVSMAANETKRTDATVGRLADLDKSVLEKRVVGSISEVRRRDG